MRRVFSDSNTATLSLRDFLIFFQNTVALPIWQVVETGAKASNGGGVSGGIRTIPGSSLAGERLTLTVALDANGHPPLPPTQIRPSGVLVGNLRLTAIARPNRTSVRGTMRIPIDTEKGKKDVTVVFPGPPGRGEIRFVGEDLSRLNRLKGLKRRVKKQKKPSPDHCDRTRANPMKTHHTRN